MLKKCYIGELDTTFSTRRGSFTSKFHNCDFALFTLPILGPRTSSLLNVPKPLIVIDGKPLDYLITHSTTTYSTPQVFK